MNIFCNPFIVLIIFLLFSPSFSLFYLYYLFCFNIPGMNSPWILYISFFLHLENLSAGTFRVCSLLPLSLCSNITFMRPTIASLFIILKPSTLHIFLSYLSVVFSIYIIKIQCTEIDMLFVCLSPLH